MELELKDRVSMMVGGNARRCARAVHGSDEAAIREIIEANFIASCTATGGRA